MFSFDKTSQPNVPKTTSFGVSDSQKLSLFGPNFTSQNP